MARTKQELTYDGRDFLAITKFTDGGAVTELLDDQEGIASQVNWFRKLPAVSFTVEHGDCVLHRGSVYLIACEYYYTGAAWL